MPAIDLHQHHISGNDWLLFSFSIFTDQTNKRMFQWYIPPHCYGYRVTPANIKGNYFTQPRDHILSERVGQVEK